MLNKGQFTLYATFLAKEDKYEALKELNARSFEATKNAPGLIQMMFLDPPKPNLPFVFIAFWNSKADFEQFMQDPETLKFHNSKMIQQFHQECLKKASAQFYQLNDHWVQAH